MGKPKLAHYVTVAKCDCGCGQVHLVLWSKKDKCIAVAPFPVETAHIVARDIIEAAGPSIGVAVGHA